MSWADDNGRIANLVLQDTIERVFANNLYADIQRGIYLVRGENVLLLGEIVRLRMHLNPKLEVIC